MRLPSLTVYFTMVKNQYVLIFGTCKEEYYKIVRPGRLWGYLGVKHQKDFTVTKNIWLLLCLLLIWTRRCIFFDSYKEFNILSFQKAKLHQQNPLYVKYLKLFLHPTLFGFFTVANEMESCLCLFRSVFFAVWDASWNIQI